MKLDDTIYKKLKKEEVISLSTDTVAGLVCLASSELASSKIYELKKRDKNKALSLIAADIQMVERYLKLTALAKQLLNDETYSITIIADKLETAPVNRYISADKTLAIRIPKAEALTSLITSLDEALVATSANFSGEDILSASEIPQKLGIPFFNLVTNPTNSASIIINTRNNQLDIIRATDQQREYLNARYNSNT